VEFDNFSEVIFVFYLAQLVQSPG